MQNRCKILISFLFIASFSFSQSPLKFIPFNSSNGLSQNAVHCLYQDKQGLLWVGTQDGLNSFDGKSFVTYRYNPNDTTTLSDQFILAIEEDEAGFLWIETRSGVNRLNKQTGKCERFYISEKEKNGLPRTAATLLKNKQNHLFLPSSTEAIYFTNSIKPNYLSKIYCFNKACVIDNNNNLWTITNTGGLQFISANFLKESNFKIKVKIPNYNSNLGYKLKFNTYINCIYIYNLVNAEVIVYNISTTQFSTFKLISNATIKDILFINETLTWFATSKGIYSKQANNNPISLASNALPLGAVLCLYKDEQQNIWAGTATGGFAFHNPSFTNYAITQTPNQNDAISGYASTTKFDFYAAASGLFNKPINKQTLQVHKQLTKK